MNILELLRQLLNYLMALCVAIAQLLDDLPAQSSTATSYDSMQDNNQNNDPFGSGELNEDDFTTFSDLPPPPEKATPPGRTQNEYDVTLVYPKKIDLEYFTAMSLVDPETAEQARWRQLQKLKIERSPNQTPIEAWLAYTRVLNRNTHLTIDMLLTSPTITALGKRWILFLIGVNTTNEE